MDVKLIYVVVYFWVTWALLVAFYPGRFCYRLFYALQALYRKARYNVDGSHRVVVVGGGFAGTTVARGLQQFFQVTLVDTKEFFEFTPSVLRTIVEPERLERIQVVHADYLDQTEVVVGKVCSIDRTSKEVFITRNLEQEVHHEADHSLSIPYDTLVVCSGSYYHTPFKDPNLVISSRAEELVGCTEQLVAASSILIIGGGTVGVELAAEIALKYPLKKLVLVHGRERLLTRSTAKASRYAENFLRSHGCELVFNERVLLASMVSTVGSRLEPASVRFQAESGVVFTAQMAFVCTGMSPNSSFLPSGSGMVDDRGFVTTDDHLQVAGCGNCIFAAGDVVSGAEEKLAQGAQKHASVVASNILLKVDDRGKPFKVHKGKGAYPIVISLGKYDAIFTWGRWTFTGFIPALCKEAVEWKVMITY